MKPTKIATTFLIAALTAIGLAAATPPSPQQGSRTFACRMTGEWDGRDDFSFDAQYIEKDGTISFSGVYDNPGTASADVRGTTSSGKWNITFTYTDPGHRGMTKTLVGDGRRDGTTFKITGTYKSFTGGTDAKKDGRFTFNGTCRAK